MYICHDRLKGAASVAGEFDVSQAGGDMSLETVFQRLLDNSTLKLAKRGQRVLMGAWQLH